MALTKPVMPSASSAALSGHVLEKAFDADIINIHEQLSLDPSASKSEMQQRFWALYALAVDVTVPLISSDGKSFLVRRCKYNSARGDKARQLA